MSIKDVAPALYRLTEALDKAWKTVREREPHTGIKTEEELVERLLHGYVQWRKNVESSVAHDKKHRETVREMKESGLIQKVEGKWVVKSEKA